MKSSVLSAFVRVRPWLKYAFDIVCGFNIRPYQILSAANIFFALQLNNSTIDIGNRN